MKLFDILTLTDNTAEIRIYKGGLFPKAVAKCSHFFTDIELMKFLDCRVTHICPCDDYMAIDIAE